MQLAVFIPVTNINVRVILMSMSSYVANHVQRIVTSTYSFSLVQKNSIIFFLISQVKQKTTGQSKADLPRNDLVILEFVVHVLKEKIWLISSKENKCVTLSMLYGIMGHCKHKLYTHTIQFPERTPRGIILSFYSSLLQRLFATPG